MTTLNYIGWWWIIWTLFNEGLVFMVAPDNSKRNVIGGIVLWILSALAVWAALS